LLVRDSAFFLAHKAKNHPYFWSRFSLLLLSKIRNSHPVFSICLRNTGTNFTPHQRLLCVVSSLATSLAINAIFYGYTFETPASETTTTLMVIVIAGIIPKFGKMWFVKHKMTLHTSSKQRIVDKWNEQRTRFKYWIGCYCFGYPFKSFFHRKSDDRGGTIREKAKLNNAKLAIGEHMNRSEQDEMVMGGVINTFLKPNVESFFVHNESAYGFKDEIGERTLNRTVKLDFSLNPFQSLQETFNFFDEDNNGHISKQKFTEALTRLGEDIISEEVENMMDKMDLDGDGMINFAEFSRAMANIHFEEDGQKSRHNVTRRPHLTRKEKNLRAAEIMARSKALTFRALEANPGERDEGHMINLEVPNIRGNLNNCHNTAAVEGEESHSFEDTRLEPGTTLGPLIRRNLMGVSNEGRCIKDFTDNVIKLQLMPIQRPQTPSVKKDRVVHTSLSIDLDNLDQESESLEVASEINKECGFLSKPGSGQYSYYGTSVNLALLKPIEKPQLKHIRIVGIDESDASSESGREKKDGTSINLGLLKPTEKRQQKHIRLLGIDETDASFTGRESDESEYVPKNINFGQKMNPRESHSISKLSCLYDGGDDHSLLIKWENNLLKRSGKEQGIAGENQDIQRKREDKRKHKEVRELYQAQGKPLEGREDKINTGKIKTQKKIKMKDFKKQEEHVACEGDVLVEATDTSEEEPLTPGSVPLVTPDCYKRKEGETSQWITSYGLNSMANTITSTCRLKEQAVKSPFMMEESPFWISNRVAELAGVESARELRQFKNWELKVVVEFQEMLLGEALKMPKTLLKFAWCCFFLWVLGMIGIIFLFGVNMDSDAEEKPGEDIIAAATTSCPAREVAGSGYTLNVDVSADDAFNLKGAQGKADAVNANFTRYGNVFPEWLTPPDFDFMPEDTPESYRFIASSVTSWASGTVIVPLLTDIIIAFIVAIVHRNEAKRLRLVMANVAVFRHADITDYNLADKTFFICCWPGVLIEILTGETKEGECNLRISNRSILEMIVGGIEKFLNCELS